MCLRERKGTRGIRKSGDAPTRPSRAAPVKPLPARCRFVDRFLPKWPPTATPAPPPASPPIHSRPAPLPRQRCLRSRPRRPSPGLARRGALVRRGASSARPPHPSQGALQLESGGVRCAWEVAKPHHVFSRFVCRILCFPFNRLCGNPRNPMSGGQTRTADHGRPGATRTGYGFQDPCQPGPIL